MDKNFWHILKIVIWVSFFISIGLIYYVNHYMPRGPMYDTGDVVCMNDDRGPCAGKYQEDVSNLDIPDWAKFFKKSEGELLTIVLLITAFWVSMKDKE